MAHLTKYLSFLTRSVHINSQKNLHIIPRPASAFRKVFLSSEGSSASGEVEWRKKQLDKLERKFAHPETIVENDEDLQPMWKEMEGRVTRRRSRTISENGGRTGRENIRQTDEEYWLREGLYTNESSDEKDGAN